MKKQISILLLMFCFVGAFSQAVTEKKSESKGTGKAMENNLNEPNSVNPAKNNNQKYEKGAEKPKTMHPEKSTGNSYNKSNYDNSNKGK